jgi:hypothetical protein
MPEPTVVITRPFVEVRVSPHPLIVVPVREFRVHGGVVHVVCHIEYPYGAPPVHIPAGEHQVTLWGEDDTICSRWLSPFPQPVTVDPGDANAEKAGGVTLTLDLPIRLDTPE